MSLDLARFFEDDADRDALVLAARRLADGLLAPAAAAVDTESVPRSHLDAIASAGLLGLEAPRAAGGAQASAGVRRRVTEVLAGADLTTWFVQVQHHAPVRALACAGAAFGSRLADLATGRRIAGIAFSHLRHWPRRPVEAVPVGGGDWLLDGVAPWYTGWGLNDVALVAAATRTGEVVFALVDARPASGLIASAPLDVAALRGALTVALRFDGFVVPAADVVSVQPVADWLRADADATANVNPAVLGLTESALRLLVVEGERRGEPAAVRAADRLARRWREVRDQAYRLLDDAEGGELLQDRLRLRALAHQVMVEATSALVVAGAGPAMAVTSPAQRKAREAMFLLVQAQTAASRAANLDLIGTAERASWDARDQ